MIKNNHKNKILAPISLGELIDKITILEIKKYKFTNEKARNVDYELNLLKNIIPINQDINIKYKESLKEINLNLWEIEERLRIKEENKEFDQEFINLARKVYIQNDKRFAIKNEINHKYRSNIIEEKSYKI